MVKVSSVVEPVPMYFLARVMELIWLKRPGVGNRIFELAGSSARRMFSPVIRKLPEIPWLPLLGISILQSYSLNFFPAFTVV